MGAAKPLTKFQIETAMRYTKSVRAAARYLGCSYQHVKPYMKLFKVDENDINSPTLFDAHKNQMGKGIPKHLPNKRNFKDGNKSNYLIDNLEILCYNCYFLYVADPLTQDEIRHIEDNQTVLAKPHSWDLDKDQLENMKALGILE